MDFPFEMNTGLFLRDLQTVLGDLQAVCIYLIFIMFRLVVCLVGP